ncbi:MAG: GNAT family N-acetyltransferase [Alphaproteobacteria bacterium]|nr:GNAT family N-acetyltransferase [Alphaproteobacteria bacterium]
MGRKPPTIETPRLRLRAHTIDDLDACLAIWGDAAVTRFIGGRPFTREEVWDRVLRYSGMWSLVGHGFWAVEARDGGGLIGEVGIMEAKRAIEPSLEGEPEVGWAFSPTAQGRGYASEAVASALAWGDAMLEAPKLVCIIAPENAASLKLAGKLGFVERARTTYHGEPTIQFERTRQRQNHP